MYKHGDIVRVLNPMGSQRKSPVYFVLRPDEGSDRISLYDPMLSNGNNTMVRNADIEKLGSFADFSKLVDNTSNEYKTILDELNLNNLLPKEDMLDLSFLNDGIDEARISKVYSYETLVEFVIKSLIIMKRLHEINENVQSKKTQQQVPANDLNWASELKGNNGSYGYLNVPTSQKISTSKTGFITQNDLEELARKIDGGKKQRATNLKSTNGVSETLAAKSGSFDIDYLSPEPEI